MQVKLTGLELLVYRHTRMNELLMCSKNSGAEGVVEYGPAGGPFVVAFDDVLVMCYLKVLQRGWVEKGMRTASSGKCWE